MGTLYFSEKLTGKLEHILDRPVSALEAPAGYGKTTAVHRILEKQEGLTAWYTAVESIPDSSFQWFIRQIGQADETAACKLQGLGFLNRSNAVTAAGIIEEMRLEEPMTLVFDNFQFSLHNWEPQILDSLAKRRPDGLKTIFIAQDFGRLKDILHSLEDSLCLIRSSDMLLEERDILAYAKLLDVDITEKEAGDIRRLTDGWAAAAALYLNNLREGDEIGQIRTIDDLLFELFWKRLDLQQQEFLLRISLFDRLSDSVLDDLIPEGRPGKKEREQILLRSPLIRNYEARKEYYPHEIMLSFLAGRLADAPLDFRRDVYRRSGDVCRKSGEIKAAVSCYFKAEDYAGLLSCPLVCMSMEEFGGISSTDLARTVLRTCSPEIQKHYPLSLLRLCYILYAGCAFDEFELQMRKLKTWFDDMGDDQLLGEWFLVDALSDFPDLDKMEQKYVRAEELMTGPSQIFIPEEPFMFGCTSMWYLFYTKAGSMMETADTMDRVMKVYNRITRGHGAGAAEIYRGGALWVQGRFEESDIQAYLAGFLAEQSENVTAAYGAALLLGMNAIYRGDMSGLQKAIDYLEKKARSFSFMQGKMLNTCMLDTVRGYLLGLMMETSRSAMWTQGDADALTDLTFTNFIIKTCRMIDLLLKKEYKRAIASIEASLQLDERLISLPTKCFMYCGLALCYLAIGKPVKAEENLDRSLTLAEKDKNYTFLASFRKYLKILFMFPHIASSHAEAIAEIKALDMSYTRADESHLFEMLSDEKDQLFDLTEREREIAELAAKGLRNREIAKKLFISENTVKHHLKTAFQKMNIDRRSRLVEMLR